MPNIVVVHNRKGGAGKTTMSIHIADGLSKSGQKVLLIDGDSQGNCALGLGLNFGTDTEDWLMRNRWHPHTISPTLDLLASGPSETVWWESVTLALLVKESHWITSYDWVIIDTAPGDSLFNRAVIRWSSKIIIPANLQFYSAAGVLNLLKSVPRERVLGIVPNFYDLRTKRTLEVLENIKAQFPMMLSPRPIRQCVDLERASEAGQSIWDWNPHATAADDYYDLIEWMVSSYGEN